MHLAHDQLFGVAQDDADAAEEAILPEYLLDLATACIVSSLTLEPPSRTMRMVESFLPNINCWTSAGSISVGTAGPARR